jgi:hypothetical protein
MPSTTEILLECNPYMVGEGIDTGYDSYHRHYELIGRHGKRIKAVYREIFPFQLEHSANLIHLADHMNEFEFPVQDLIFLHKDDIAILLSIMSKKDNYKNQRMESLTDLKTKETRIRWQNLRSILLKLVLYFEQSEVRDNLQRKPVDESDVLQKILEQSLGNPNSLFVISDWACFLDKVHNINPKSKRAKISTFAEIGKDQNLFFDVEQNILNQKPINIESLVELARTIVLKRSQMRENFANKTEEQIKAEIKNEGSLFGFSTLTAMRHRLLNLLTTEITLPGRKNKTK